MDLRTVLYDKYNNTGFITLNRPECLNALNLEMLSELSLVIEDISGDNRIRAVIITGSGKMFAGGWDTAYLADADVLKAERFIESARILLDRIDNLDRPVIAALNGPSLCWGTELALACDIRIASDTAYIAEPEINLGIIPGAGGTQRLIRITGAAWAKHLIMTGSPVDAYTALSIGLVTSVVPEERLMCEAEKIAKTIALRSAISMKAAKRSLNYGMNVNLPAGLAYESNTWASLFSTDDQKEGMKAFLERRKPVFRNR